MVLDFWGVEANLKYLYIVTHFSLLIFFLDATHLVLSVFGHVLLNKERVAVL